MVSTTLFFNEMSLPKKKDLSKLVIKLHVFEGICIIMCQYLVTNMRVESEWT